jgi:SAM-dependent methyltransferase
MRCELTQEQQSATSQGEVEYSACPHGCAASDNTLHEFGRFSVCRCEQCGLVRLDPRLAEAQLAELYERDYFSGEHATGYDSYERDQQLYEKTFARRIKLICRYKSTGRLLDIGCSLGYFLNVADSSGFDVFGIDVSAYAVEHCQPRFPGRVRQGLLEPRQFAPSFFDVVTMFDLFEHVYHPRAFLTSIYEITKDDGIVVITTPNHRSFLSRLSKRNWVSYKIPEHVYFYTPETLRRMVAPLFEVELVRSEGQYCSFEFRSERVKTLSRPVGRVMLSVVRGLGVKDCTVYVNSGSMTAVLRKKVPAGNRSPA